MSPAPLPVLASLNALAGGLFLLSAFAIVATRQAAGCLRFFVAQSITLAASAFLVGAQPFSWHLWTVGVVNIASKVVLIPWVLRRTMRGEVYTRREIVQVVNIPASLLTALALAIAAYFFVKPVVESASAGWGSTNVPPGMAAVLLGAYTLTVRREAVPQLIGLLAMENGAFFAGIALSPDLPLIAELAIAFDVLILALVAGVLTRAIHEHIGTTEVGRLSALREEPSR